MDNAQNTPKEKSLLPAILIIAQIIFIVIAISIIVLNSHSEEISSVDYKRQPKVTIENLKSVLPDATNNYTDVLETHLANTVELNTNNYNVTSSKAIIRDGSFKMVNLDKDNVVFYSMIIDIPELEQSYQIYDHYSGDKEPANRMYILCLDDNAEKVYPDFDCRDEYPDSTRRDIATSYIGYFDFGDFHAFTDQNDKTAIGITPYSPDITEDQKASYIRRTKEAVSSLSVSPDLFNYLVLDPAQP